MFDSLTSLAEAVSALGEAWRRSGEGDPVDVDALSRSDLVAVNDALGVVARSVDALRARVASEISRQSRPELGADGLARQNGFRNATVFLASTTGVTMGEASRLVAVGDATAPRRTFAGAAAPSRHPHVGEALDSARIGLPAASAIITMLDRVALRCTPADLDAAERRLVAHAPGLTLDQLAKVIARAEAHLDPDGLEPKEQHLRSERSLHMFERDGLVHLTAKLDPETAAPVQAAIKAIVTAEFRNENDGATDAAATRSDDPDTPRRTLPQRQADALALLCAHALGCDGDGLPVEGATVIVRMTLDDLQSGAGSATIDGIAQPISVSTARRMAASGRVIPCVLGGTSEILDWGRARRLFSKAQRLALAERDGGCAMCGLDPGMTKAHHIRWWSRDAGPTDLSNGVLLCESCHHRIHENGWEVRVEGVGVDGRVWFVPPPHVDATRTPRLGGAARFSFAA